MRRNIQSETQREKETVCNNVEEEDYEKRERQRGKKCTKVLGFKSSVSF